MERSAGRFGVGLAKDSARNKALGGRNDGSGWFHTKTAFIELFGRFDVRTFDALFQLWKNAHRTSDRSIRFSST